MQSIRRNKYEINLRSYNTNNNDEKQREWWKGAELEDENESALCHHKIFIDIKINLDKRKKYNLDSSERKGGKLLPEARTGRECR